MSGSWLIGVCTSVVMMLGPPPPELSEPPEPEGAAPIEGPAPPPGIELRPQPDPEIAPESESAPVSEGDAAPGVSEPLWPDPGNAPGDGSAAFVTAGVLMPTGVVVPLALLRDTSLSDVDEVGIIVASVGLELIGVGVLALGISRRVKLHRWAVAYRVQATPQGGGLLALGGLAGTAGLTMLPLGIFVLVRGGSPPVGTGLAIAGAASLGLLAPLGIVLGKRRHDAYVVTGGWVRPPLPQVGFAPLLLPRGAGLSAGGRF